MNLQVANPIEFLNPSRTRNAAPRSVSVPSLKGREPTSARGSRSARHQGGGILTPVRSGFWHPTRTGRSIGPDRNSRWHQYDLTEPGTVDQLLDEIDDDPTDIFWGYP